MDNAVITIPATMAGRDARLFWLLARELYRDGFLSQVDMLIDSDWSEILGHEDGEDLACGLAELLFAQDDLERLQTISEGFSPSAHPLYFRRLREMSKKIPQSKRSIGWMQSQKLIGQGLDGFKEALREGHVELARKLHSPSSAEAEALFYQLTNSLTKEALGLLLFKAPALSDFKALLHASNARANEEVLCFLTWKIEESRPKAQLRNPDGDESMLLTLMLQALSRRQFTWAKKLLEWNHSLAFDRFEPKELAPPWDDDAALIKLDGSLSLTPSDFCALYAHEGFGRALSDLKAPEPNMPKVAALLAALAKKLETRKPGTSQYWSSVYASRAKSAAVACWPLA